MTSFRNLPKHGEGGPQSEIALLLSIAPLTVLLRNILIPWIFLGQRFPLHGKNYWYKYVIDFCLLVVPLILAVTTFADRINVLLVLLCVVIITVLIFLFVEYAMLSRDRLNIKNVLNEFIDENNSPTMFVTYFRGSIFLSVAIVILAVDFGVFPRRFAKTDRGGHSLMDTGVAAFVYAAGISRPLQTNHMREQSENRRMSSRFSFLRSSSFVLVVIGSFRTFVLWLLEYPQEVTEYGVHWNFFYTLAAITVVSRVLPPRHPMACGLFFLISHHVILSWGAGEWVLDDSSPRDSLLSANREGVFSLPGYLALFFLARSIGFFVSSTGIRLKCWLRCCLSLMCLALCLLGMQWMATGTMGGPSRRLVNVPYILAMMALFTFYLGLCLLVQSASFLLWAANLPHFQTDGDPFAGSQPCLLQALNAQSLVFFLFANLSTGLVNMLLPHLFPSGEISDYCSVAFITAHSLLCTAVVFYYRSGK